MQSQGPLISSLIRRKPRPEIDRQAAHGYPTMQQKNRRAVVRSASLLRERHLHAQAVCRCNISRSRRARYPSRLMHRTARSRDRPELSFSKAASKASPSASALQNTESYEPSSSTERACRWLSWRTQAEGQCYRGFKKDELFRIHRYHCPREIDSG